MAFHDEEELMGEGGPVGWRVTIVRAGGVLLILAYLLLLLYFPLIWSVVSAIIVAFVLGLFVTTFILGVSDRKRSFQIAPLVGLVILGVLWFVFKTQLPAASQGAPGGQARA